MGEKKIPAPIFSDMIAKICRGGGEGGNGIERPLLKTRRTKKTSIEHVSRMQEQSGTKIKQKIWLLLSLILDKRVLKSPILMIILLVSKVSMYVVKRRPLPPKIPLKGQSYWTAQTIAVHRSLKSLQNVANIIQMV